MHPVEIESALNGMVVLYDTREQPTEKQRTRLKQMNCPVERTLIQTGDYSAKFPLPNGTWYDMRDICSVERKMSIDELCMCFGSERDRFEREFERAKESGQRLILLVEDANWIKLFSGAYRSQFNPKSLRANILAWTARYDCRFFMCPESVTGILIKEILYYEGRERLTALD